MRRLYLLVVAMLACGLLAAGCGGGDDKGGGDGGGSSANPDVKASVASCKQSADQAQGVSQSVKNDLKDICEKAGNGDEAAVRKATQDVCVKIIEETVPAGAARDQSVAACKQAGDAK